MNVTVDPIWSWLWSVSVASLLKPLGEIGVARIFVVLTIWLLGLVLAMPGTGARRLLRIVLGFGVPVVVLMLAYLPLGMAFGLALAGITIWTYAGVEKVTLLRLLAVLGLRLGALVVAMLLVLRPSLAFQEDPHIPSTLVVLFDASKSMGIHDELGDSRWQRALTILRSERCTRLLEQLKTDKNVQVVFYRAAEDVRPFDPIDKPGEPDGKRTDIGQWLHSLYQRHAADPNLRGLVLFSDGIDNGTRHQAGDLAEQWGRIPCPIYTFSLGKKETTLKQRGISFLPDSMTADPSPVGVKNELTVRARLQSNGFQNPEVTVELYLDNDAKPAKVKKLILDKPLPDNPNVYDVHLSCDAPPRAREMKVTLKVKPLPGEINVGKDSHEISTFVTVIKEGISVLYVEGAYRWEARFIRDAINGYRNLRLYKSFRIKDAPVDANEPDLYRFDKYHYDVIIIGDISASRFAGGKPEVLKKVQKLVADEGVGLMMLGGFETFGNSDWQTFGKPIADILPVTLEKKENLDQGIKVRVEPTAQGFGYIMGFKDTLEENNKFWERIPPLEGMTPLGKKKPGATVLAQRATRKDQPLLVSSSYGKGRVLAFACDSTWNCWRRTPEMVQFHKRFWQKVVVWLAQQENMPDSIHLEPEQRRVAAANKLDFVVGLRGKDDRKVKEPKFRVKVIAPDRTQTIVPTAGKPGEDQHGSFLKTDLPGEYQLEAVALDTKNKVIPGKKAVTRFLVYDDDVELRRPAANPESLEKISRKSEGRQRPATEENLAEFLEELRNKPLPQATPKVDLWPDWKRNPPSRTLDDQVETLVTSGILLSFVLFVALVCLEWYLRRRWGMV
jgi:uncharacterized membrane protein